MMVNLDEVAGVDHAPNGEFMLRLRDNSRVPLTRGLREFQERLEASH